MSSVLPQRKPRKAAHEAVPVPRQRFLKTMAGFVVSGFVRGKIRRADTNMDSLRRLLQNYLSIISPDDQEDILLHYNQLQQMKKNLRSRGLPSYDHYKQAKTYEETSILTLEAAKNASDRALDGNMMGQMAMNSGLANFSTPNRPLPGQAGASLHRVDSTTSDWSNCTLPLGTVSMNAQQSRAGENASVTSMNGIDEDSSSRSESPMMTAPSFDEESIAPLTDLSSLAPTSVGD